MMGSIFVMALLTVIGCGGECADDEFTCAGEVLMECVDGELVESEDCAASEMICHAMGDGTDHCMTEGDMEM